MDKEDVVYTYSGILFSHKKKQTLPCATTWMNIEDIMLSEIRESKILYDLTLVWNLKNKQTNKNLINTENRLVVV